MISPRDTIVVNDTVLDAFRHSNDYARELVPDHETNYFDRILNALKELFDFDEMINAVDIPDWGWWCLGALVLAIVCYLIWKYWVGLFDRRDVRLKAEEITEDDINEVDFDQLIAEAEKNNDYLTLCRLLYLQTLKAASDASLVTWRRYKTPTQYATEWCEEDFGFMTNHFLRIRYGHYTASADLAREMRSRQAALLERIASLNLADRKNLADQQQEGGEQP